MTISMCVSSLVIGYFYGWQLSLVLTAALPVNYFIINLKAMGVCGTIMVLTQGFIEKRTSEAYSKASGRSEQAINAIKTVKSMGAEIFEHVDIFF